jgi:hypothetical protein
MNLYQQYISALHLFFVGSEPPVVEHPEEEILIDEAA